MAFRDACVVLTRAVEDNHTLRRLCEQDGMLVLENPLIETFPLDTPALRNALATLEDYDAIIATSGNAFRTITKLGMSGVPPASIPCYVVGERTATLALTLGFEAIHPAGVKRANDLFAYLQQNGIASKVFRKASQPHFGTRGRFLWLHGQLADGGAADRLREAGYTVDSICCYETRPLAMQSSTCDRLVASACPVIAFYSPSAVQAYLNSSTVQTRGQELARILCVAIGATTASEVTSNGLLLAETARRANDTSVYDAICGILSR